MRPKASSKASVACSKVTPCLRRLLTALRLSHSKSPFINVLIISIDVNCPVYRWQAPQIHRMTRRPLLSSRVHPRGKTYDENETSTTHFPAHGRGRSRVAGPYANRKSTSVADAAHQDDRAFRGWGTERRR